MNDRDAQGDRKPAPQRATATHVTPVNPVRITAFAPLKVTTYRRLWLSMIISSLGTFLQLTAGPWVMLEMTGSPFMVGLVTTALLLPRLLFTLPAGALADVIDRRTLVIIGHVTCAVPAALMAVLVAVDLLNPGLLLALTFLLGLGAAFTHPAFQSMVPELVPRPMLAQAITLNAAAFNVARSVGPSIGGLLIAMGLTEVSFATNAVSYFAVIAVVMTFPAMGVAQTKQRHLWRSTQLGMRYVRHTAGIRRLIMVSGTFALASASIEAVMPSWTSQDLQLGASGYGIMFGLFGFGALMGAASRERARTVVGDRMLPVTITAFGFAGVIAGLAGSVVIAGAALVVVGLTFVWTMTTLNATVQLMAPRWIRGRVVGVFLLSIGLQPLGAFLAGSLAELFGASTALVVMCAAAAILGLVTFRVDLPVLGQVSEPEPVGDDDNPLSARHQQHVEGRPIVVMTTFEINADEFDHFIGVMRQLRMVRLRTGAIRWQLLRDAAEPMRFTEMFSVPDWQEHLAQHARIDADAAKVIREARALDRRGEPASGHLAGIDPHRPPVFDQDPTAMQSHAQVHERDGSVPLS